MNEIVKDDIKLISFCFGLMLLYGGGIFFICRMLSGKGLIARALFTVLILLFILSACCMLFNIAVAIRDALLFCGSKDEDDNK